MGKAKIEFIRTSQAANSGREYEIYVDGKLEGKIANGERETIELESGEHQIIVKLDWNKSNEMKVDLEVGEEKKLICGSKLVGWRQWLALYYILPLLSDLYLKEYSSEKIIHYPEETWEEIVEKGMFYYVVKEGIIGWGFFVGFFVFLVNIIITYRHLSIVDIFRNLIINLAIFSVGGAIFGLIMWFMMEKIND
ncbi:hypothetical protein [Halonatronum saccharophilum]|uniref:hypothetical protein n=1 Tax=Halonatronum saccharophilum TaxID=150060 RepID=UPI0004BB6A47|nr:hypothetical protein [Halonatronum saccharophilum]